MKKSETSKSIAENEAEKNSGAKDFLVAGIGASAGGIQALKEFFENVPADSDVAYVVILHLSPDFDSRLAEILQTVAAIPVTQVTERVKVEPNRVYVVPPSHHLEMEDGHLTVSPNVSVEERRAPVDIFFRTLAESHRARAISVVLSGTGADGSMGLKRVKECGGVTFVQNPREAEFSEMPRNSIDTELVDAVLNANEIPAKIVAYKSNLGAVEIQDSPESRPEDDTAALREIFTVLRVRTKHEFSNYKRPTMLRRIERRLNVRELDSLRAYADYLKENPDEHAALLKDLLISVTNFFRDKDAFHFLETEVVPRILQDKRAQDEVRVWVAGCATGEEAYSIAMLLAERTEQSAVAPNIQIFATDIDDSAIAAARDGFYTLNDAADVSPERLRRFFIKDGEGFRVRSELRKMILFANHNLLKDAPFSHLDLATCRNLLIYFNGEAQERSMETFHFALNPGAFLFLGTSESVDGAGDLYAPVSKEHRVYQSRQAASRISYPVPDAPPVLRLADAKKSPANDAATGISPKSENQALERISFGDLHQQLLEQYAAPSIVVNENYDIVHLSARAGRFLQMAGGEPSKNLLHLVRPELRLELHAALAQAVQNRQNVETANLTVEINGQTETVNIQVRPVLHEEDTARGFLLVIFESSENKADADNGATERVVAATANESLARRLEAELERVKAQLRSSVEQFEIQTEELRASNEELQAINEDLRSTAEELETSREELQSVNEELMTVNQELKIKIEELSQSNSDFQNLLNSTDIGTIFLDRALRVKMFTPEASAVFNLIEADINRPLADITTRLVFADLQADVESVLDTLQTVEREFETERGKWYLLRIFPYRTAEDKISGAVVTFIEITNRVESERALSKIAQSREQQTRIFDTALSSIADFAYTFDSEGRFTYANKPLLDLLGITLEEITGKTFHELPYPKDLAHKLQAQIRQVFETKKPVTDETPFVNPAGEEGFYEYIFAPVVGENGAVEVVAGSTRVITERKKSEESLRKSEERLQQLIKNLPGGAAFIVDRDLRYLLAEGEALAEVGIQSKDLIGKTIFEALPKDSAADYEPLYRAALAGESFVHEHDEHGKTYVSRGAPLRSASGDIYAALAVSYDISDRKRAEEKLRESETQMRLVVEAAEMGTWDWDLRTGAVRWNEQHFRLFGREPETRVLSYKDFERSVHPEDREMVRERLEQAIEQDNVFQTEFRVVLPDRSTRWMSGYGRVVEREASGKVIRMTGVMFDATERKAIEEAVRQSEERLRLLVESASDYAIFSVTPDNIIESWNAGAEKVFGYAEDEIIGKSGAILFTSEDQKRGVPAMEIKCATETGKAEDERWHIRKDGSRFYASGVTQPLLDGQVRGFVKICRDQTEQIRAEKAVRDKEVLKKLVGAQEDERRRIARDLHDHLGQQMTALRLKLANVREICGDAPICAKIEEIQRTAERIDADVDFLAWELRPAALDDLGLVAALENYVKEWSRHSGIPAEFYAAGMKRVRLAPEAETNLYRITQEALNNTHKHAGTNSLSVMIERRGSLVILIIEDNGVGFDVEDKLTREKGIGLLGMGERAALLGGKVQIESTPQKGTTVFVRIPIENEIQAE